MEKKETKINTEENIWVLIVAGGSGQRMERAQPKQFLEIAGKSILQHSVAQFLKVLPNANYAVVLPKSFSKEAAEIESLFKNAEQLSLVSGGNSRFESVRNGLMVCASSSYVCVHDAVRCLLTKGLINRCVDAIKTYHAVIPVVPVVDSIRRMNAEGGSDVLQRDELRAVQTPQCFKTSLLLDAIRDAPHEKFLDEASLMQHFGHEIHLIEGEVQNLKITTPQDLVLAEYILQNRAKE